MALAREPFSETTRRILAQRAAYRCSAPNCNRLTIGPGLSDAEVENTGKAAHIYSASKGGPRGQGKLAPAQLRSVTNGIWMCGHHADLIDKNSGTRYPAQVIKSWKALHEYRTSYQHSGGNASFGFVRSLEIELSPLFKQGTRLELAKTTFLIGNNESGKSAICEWIASVDSLRHVKRWLHPNSVKFKLTFDAPIEHEFAVTAGSGAVSLTLDGTIASTNHHHVSVTFLEKVQDDTGADDLEFLCGTLHLDPVSLRALAGLISFGDLFIHSARFAKERDDEGEWRTYLYCTLENGEEVPFQGMSRSEKGRVLLAFAIAQANSTSAFAPALLIVEWPGLGIDKTGLEKYTAYFASPACRFQTLITMLERTSHMDAFGWQMYQIQGRTKVKLGSISAIQPSM